MKNGFILLAIFVLLAGGCVQKPTKQTKKTASTDSYISDPDYSVNFDRCAADTVPSGWFSAVTGNNKAGHWSVIQNQDNKLVGQTSSAGSGYLFNLLVLEKPVLKDLILSVNLKAVLGSEDQGGGLVWRYQDNDNYYVARANPLENNFRLYKVTNGNRKKLESYSLPVTSEVWHNIVISHLADTIKCYFDNQLFLQTIDLSIKKAGKTGLWTKADAVTYFDNFQLKNLDK